MRNCFVPGCDSFCKANGCTQRKMFSSPKAMFNKWKEVLPKTKREFKENDRVCERHFFAEDITEYWENTINGIIHRTKRDKPKLNSNAIPSENLDDSDNFPLYSSSSEYSKAKKATPKNIKALTSKITIKREVMDRSEIIEDLGFIPAKKLKNEDAEESKEQAANENSVTIQASCSPLRQIDEPLDEEKLEVFEMLYDEIHDVTLPSTLWGHHRCSERKFILFSTFNVENMNFHKFLLINERLMCKVFVNGKTRTTELEKEKCNSQHVSDWLEKIDEEE